MTCIPAFSSILSLSKELETQRLNRELSIVMQDEFKLNDEINQQLKNGDYRFPDAMFLNTDKRILTRIQDKFSAKIHLKQTPLYFHQHDFIEILYMYKGSCKQYIENLNHWIILQEGDLFLLNQSVVHSLIQSDECAILIKIIIPPSMLSYEFIQKMNHESDLFHFFVDAKSEQRKHYHYLHYHKCCGNEKELIQQLMTEYYIKSPYYEDAIICNLQLLMIWLERNNSRHNSCRFKLTHNSIQAGEIIQHIYEHSKTITLKELAHAFSFNQSYLSRIIKENYKMSFQDLLREIRLEKASLLLCSSDYSIEQIAELIGYQTTAPIYRGIKEKFDCSPSEYRKKYGKIRIANSQNQ